MTITRENLSARLASESAEVRRLAVMEIPLLREDGFLALLLSALGDTDWRVRKEAAAVAARLADREEVIAALITATADEENIGLRNAALNALSIGGPRAIDHIMERTHHENPDARKTAADIVGLSRDSRAVSILSELLDDDDANVQAAAAEWLGEYPGAETEKALLSCFDRESSLLTLVALQSLEKLGTTVPWEHISPLLADPLLSESIIPTLGASGAGEAVAEVIIHLADDPDACRAMAKLHDTSPELANRVEATLAACDDKVHDALWQYVNSEESDLQQAAIRCIAWMRRPESIPRFIGLARNSPYYPLMVDALAEWGEGAVTALGPLLKTETGHRLATVVGLLYRLLDDTTGEAFDADFEALLSSDHPAVITAAASAVARFGKQTSIPKLFALIDAESDRVRNAAGAALIELGDRYREAVRDTVRQVPIVGPAGVQLCRVLEKVGSAEDADAVRRGLSAKENELRRCAVRTLGRIQGAKAVESVGKALADPDLGVRMAAVDALTHIGPPAADTIATAIDTATGPMAPALVRALGRVGHPDAETILQRACERSGDVAQAAIEAAEQLGQRWHKMETLLLGHEDKEVVKAAMKSFGPLLGLKALGELIGHAEWDVRLTAVNLVERGSPLLDALGPTLKRRLEIEENDLVRRAIADRVEG